MTDRITIEHLYKIFGDAPQQALEMLRAGETKDSVLAKTEHVVGLNDVTLSVPAQAIYMVMGLSGSGKSTLARCINRLIEPTSGRILLDGEDIVSADEDRLRELRRTRISMVFQHFALLPNKSVIENVEFGLKIRGVPARERRRKADEVLAVVGLAAWGNHRPDALSGGMRQRVGLARALATDADVLIMDEAFSALDPLIRSEMQDELLRLQRVLKKTILFITHDFQEALKLGTRIAIMSDGAVVREGSPQDIVLSPGNDYVAAFTRDVDRARLFDAASVMVKADPIMLDTAGRTAGADLNGIAPAFVTDSAGRPVGVLPAEALRRIREGAAVQAVMSRNYGTVRPGTKLADVASLFGEDKPMAVVDDDGRLLGRIDPVRVLARIGTPAAMAAPQTNNSAGNQC
ncbi:quaternary amine ABC transporter ATP-binding protein [Rhodoligotrophos defluvii]|uniref:quaternary amine ABC transporter ATP-binding protein n=1 Tax=Rhodoligotrophos defluvii TaxID=2561934 RepID=UPI0010CA0AF6|nr:glycine betaine/L-proline ABC transporter ATP-binding protein [Rhodoligotrophos defluvii]